jgi:Ca2+-binding RTX toxin-like protein
VGTKRADVLHGTAKRDVIVAGAGDDRIDTRSGRDTICAGAGDDVLIGGPGGENAFGGDGQDRFYGGLQDDGLHGGVGDDLLVGDQGTDTLDGGVGSDYMRGDTGYNRIDGGPGSDTVSFATSTPYYSLAGATIGRLTSAGGGIVSRDRGDDSLAGIENVVGSVFADQFFIQYGSYFPPPFGVARGLGYQPVAGQPWIRDHCVGFVTVQCDAGPEAHGMPLVLRDASGPDPGVSVIGGGGDDRISVTPLGDGVRIESGSATLAGPGCSSAAGGVVCSGPLGYLSIYGYTGSDLIEMRGDLGRTTSVRLDGGEGSDFIRGGPADEMIEAGGSSGTERLHDVLLGGGGDDSLSSDVGDAVVFRGGPGADQLISGACGLVDGGPGGPDVAGFGIASRIRARMGKWSGPARCLLVTDRNEVLEGTSQNDVLIGDNRANPLIIGHGGDDLIQGLGGADRLRGDKGADRLLGGGGRDVLEAADGERDRRLDCGRGGAVALRDSHDPGARRC